MSSRTIGELIIKVKADGTEARTQLSQLQNDLGSIGNKMSLAITAPLTILGGLIFKSIAEMEMLESSFETMLGSADKARKHMEDLKRMAASTPFETTQLANASKMLMQYGVAVDDVIPAMRMLGDISGGNAEKFNSLALVFSQVKALGRLTGQDLRQMVNAGFNPLYVMSEKTGESMASLMDKMSKGKISFEDLTGAMQTVTGTGGKFFGGMERGSKTLTGLLSTLKDDAMEAGRNLLVGFLPAIKDIVKFISSLAQSFGKIDEPTKNFILRMVGIAMAAGPVIKGIQGVSAAFKALGTSGGAIFLVITAIVTAVNILILAMEKHNNRFKDAAKAYDDLAEKERTERENVNALVSEYNELRNKTNLSNEERVKMAGIEVRLKQALGETNIVTEDGVISLNKLKTATKDYNTVSAAMELQHARNALVMQRLELIKLIAARSIARQNVESKDLMIVNYNLWLLNKERLEQLNKEIPEQEAKIETDKKEVKVLETKLKTLIGINNESDKPSGGKKTGPTPEELEKQKALAEANAEATAAAYETAQQRIATANSKMQEEFEASTRSWANTIASNVGNVFSAFGEAVGAGKNAWAAFAKSGVEAVAAIIDALGNEFLANAAGALADGIIAAANPFTALTAPGFFSAAAAYAAAAAGAKISAGIVRGLASQIKLAYGGVVLPRSGGTPVIMAERGIKEYAVPDSSSIWGQIGNKISANMNRPINNNINNKINMPDRMSVNIGGREFMAFLTDASKNGKFSIDKNRGVSKR